MNKSMLIAAIIALTLASLVRADIIVSEVHPTGSSATYKADFFELTNTGTAAVDITGWKVDDSSNAFVTAVALRGVPSIAAGQSVVFAEGKDDGSTDDALKASFKAVWFGTNVPAAFTMGVYGGSGIGLGSSGDAINIFDATGTPVTGVSFGAATLGVTFDNAAGLTGPISTLSVVGINGAFTSVAGGETGSPGTIGAVPEPGTLGLLGVGALIGGCALAFRRK